MRIKFKPLFRTQLVSEGTRVSTAQTFGTQDKPVIALSGFNVDAVQMRVYHVKNPVEFYRRIENTHNFGSELPRPVGKRSLLERIHSWKRGLRARHTFCSKVAHRPGICSEALSIAG
jgi:hypothetical protein